MGKEDKGEVMLEGMIVMIMTMFILIWILAIGFVYYQRYLVTAVTNDAAVKIAATFSNPGSDLIMGYIASENLSDRDLYRNSKNSRLRDINEKRAEAYVRYKLKGSSFSGVIGDNDISVRLKLVEDSVFRKHVEVTTECTFHTPFGEALNLFGMRKDVSYQAVGRADYTDIIDYISTIDFAGYQLSGTAANSKIMKAVNNMVKLYNDANDLWREYEN